MATQVASLAASVTPYHLFNQFYPHCKDCRMEYIDIPVKVERTKSTDPFYRIESWPIMYPHSIISFLYRSTSFNIPKSAVKHFWKTSRENQEPWALWSKAGDTCIPIGLYGDGVTIHLKVGSESIASLSLSFPLWRPRSCRSSRFLMFCIPERILFGQLTLNCVLRKIVWSCNAAYEGYHPTWMPHGPLSENLSKFAGQKLCPGSETFTVTELRGDWAWHRKTFQFRARWQGLEVCHACGAKANGPWIARYYNFSGTAEWENNPFSEAQIIARMLPDDNVCRYTQSFIRVSTIVYY